MEGKKSKEHRQGSMKQRDLSTLTTSDPFPQYWIETFSLQDEKGKHVLSPNPSAHSNQVRCISLTTMSIRRIGRAGCWSGTGRRLVGT
jgi:hypothetical protein